MNEVLNETVLKALYYQFKRQVLSLYFQKQDLYADSFVYAITHDIYPLFSNSNEINLYDSIFDVSKEKISTVTHFLDEKWRTGVKDNYPTFYNLEDHFESLGIDRTDLIRIIRYCALDGRFDKDLWEKIKSDCPCEADFIDDEFNSSFDIYVD